MYSFEPNPKILNSGVMCRRIMSVVTLLAMSESEGAASLNVPISSGQIISGGPALKYGR